MVCWVCTCGSAVVLEDLTHHQFVFAESERVAVDSHRVEVHVGVGTLRLVRGGTVIVPDGTF